MGDTSAHNQHEVIYEKKRAAEGNDKVARILKPYASFLVRYPSVIMCATLLVVLFAVLLGLLDSLGAKDAPDFSNPTKGFEPRGTILSSRIKSFDNIKAWYDKKILNHNLTAAQLKLSTSKRKKRSISDDSIPSAAVNRQRRDLTNWYMDINSLKYVVLYNPFLLVYKHVNDADLLNLQSMKDICQIYDDKIKTVDGFFTSGIPHHIPNYIALYSGNTTCQDITQKSTDDFFGLLKLCAPYYRKGSLKKCAGRADKTECSKDIDEIKCYSHSDKLALLLYNTYHYLTDIKFSQTLDTLKLTTSITDEIIEAKDFEPLYNNLLVSLDKTRLNNIQVVAFDLNNLKFELFQSAIIVQSLWIIGAIICVILFIWLFSGSIFVSLMTLMCIIFALVISYFVYGRIFDMDFFPFLNMVTLIFIVGIGADDAFVFTGIWEEAKHIYKIGDKQQHDEYLTKWTIHSLRHAVLAMLVTSLTTAAAFYANISSSITSVKCFGLYAGTSIIVNYLLMITFFPVVVILHEKYFGPCTNKCSPNLCKARPVLDLSTEQPSEPTADSTLFKKLHYHAINFSSRFFDEYLPNAIFKFRYVCIIVFLALGITGAILTFVTPGLSLPTSKDFQMFVTSNSLENYELTYKKQFLFSSSNSDGDRIIYFIFGVQADDNGYHFNPDSKGTLKLTNGGLKIQNEQKWLLKFCTDVKNTTFYINSQTCTQLEQFFQSLQATCPTTSKQCCEHTIPMDGKEFLKCYYGALDASMAQPSSFSYSYPLFDEKNELQVIRIPVQTSFQYTGDNKINKKTYDTLEEWFNKYKAELKEPSMADVFWFGWDFDFYDLQVSLFKGTKESFGIAISVAFVVILITSLNIILSLYSILTIFFIISVTIGILVISGWDLNIMESVIFSVAAGLAADFTLHYSVAYKTSLMKEDRVERTKSSLSHIGAAILMGAFTTFVAGLVMVPSQVLVYFQMAQFLMLTMFVSWMYSTFFFLPLCMVMGPTNNFGQLTCSKVKRARNSIRGGGPGKDRLSMESIERKQFSNQVDASN